MLPLFRIGGYFAKGASLVIATTYLWTHYKSANKNEIIMPSLLGLVVAVGVLFFEISPLPGIGNNTVATITYQGKRYSLPLVTYYAMAAPYVTWSASLLLWSMSLLFWRQGSRAPS